MKHGHEAACVVLCGEEIVVCWLLCLRNVMLGTELRFLDYLKYYISKLPQTPRPW